MRVISGSCKGRKLLSIPGHRIRPTSDRVKEAVFNILGPMVSRARVLDLFSGTGALGIEALSRGAAHAAFMDLDCGTLRDNLEHCRLIDNAEIIEADIVDGNGLNFLTDRKYDLVFLDPPYGKGYIEMVLEKHDFLNLLTPDTIVVAEHAAREIINIRQPALDIYRQKKYSKTMITLIKKTGKKNG